MSLFFKSVIYQLSVLLFIILSSLCISALTITPGREKDVAHNAPYNFRSISNKILTKPLKEIEHNSNVKTGKRNSKTFQMLMNAVGSMNMMSGFKAMFDSNNGVRKEWVPLGSLIFSRPLGQKVNKRSG